MHDVGLYLGQKYAGTNNPMKLISQVVLTFSLFFNASLWEIATFANQNIIMGINPKVLR